jgi:hypothetical protein
MAIQGLRDTTGFVSDARPKNWREGILLLYPNGKAPLTGLTSVMSKRDVDDPEYNWWEKALSEQKLEGDASITNSATTISVSSGALTLKEGHLLWIKETDEIVLVASDPSSDTSISVVRGYSGSSASSFDPTTAGNDPYYYVIGNAQEEGSNAPTGINYDPTKRYNYTQIFRNTLEMTRTASKTRLRTGDQVREAKRECLEYHSIEMERAFWFGKRNETTRNGKPIRTTGGITSFIDSNNVRDQAGSAMDMETLEEDLFNLFQFGSSEKMCFTGNRGLLTLNQIVRKNTDMTITPGIKEFGMNVTRLTCPFGEVVIKTHPLFNQMGGGTNGGSAYLGVDSWLYFLDMQEIKYVYLEGSDTKYEKKLQSNDLDGMKSGYITECGLEVHHPKSHYLVKGVSNPAADS